LVTEDRRDCCYIVPQAAKNGHVMCLAFRRVSVWNSGNCEYYDAETGAGCGLDPFWGWSLLAHFMPYEEASEGDITAI